MYDGKKDKAKDYHLQLHMAATNGNVGLVKFALDHGAPIDSVVNGFLPLQLACISDNNIAVVQYLIDRGAQVNAQRWSKKHSADKSQAVAGAIGSTALHVACANGCSRIVDLLLRNDARVDLKDKYGSRPLDIAAAKHHMEIVKLLETFGALQRHESSFQGGRRSMDVIYSTKKQHQQHQQQQLSTSNSYQSTTTSKMDDRADRMRRPSLPSVFEGKSHFSKRKPSTPSLDIPPLSTLPPAPLQYSSNIKQSTSLDQPALASSMENTTHSIDIVRHRRPSRNKLPELAWSKSSDETMVGTPPAPPLPPNSLPQQKMPTSNKHDWYSYGVLHHDGQENYLTSLERRAYGLDDMPTRQSFDQVRPHRLSLETILDPQVSQDNASSSPLSSSSSSSLRPSLKRCSSDGGHLRTTALMNAMAAKNTSFSAVPPLPTIQPPPQQQQQEEEPLPRRSLALDDDSLRQFEEKDMKKAWWSAFGGRKSMDVATYQRHLQHQDSFCSTTSSSRPSLDFRPSFDVGGGMVCPGQNATGDEVDMNFEADEYDDEPRRPRKPGFFTRWVGAWSKKGG